MSTPIVPPAPGRLSTMNCWPIEAPRRAATKRAMKSFPPPGGKATTIFTGLTGYACACAELQPIIKAAAMNTCDNELCKERIGMSLWETSDALTKVLRLKRWLDNTAPQFLRRESQFYLHVQLPWGGHRTHAAAAGPRGGGRSRRRDQRRALRVAPRLAEPHPSRAVRRGAPAPAISAAVRAA